MATTKIKIKKSKKKEASQDKKLRDQVITSKTSSFISLSNEELINKSKELIIDICNETSNEDNLITYEALINAMEKKNIQQEYSYNSKYKYYPDYSDKKFNEKIYKKIEFYLNKNYKIKKMNPKEKEILSKQLCDPLYETINGEKSKQDVLFNLTKNQKFLKAFLSPATPYNSMLLYHGTGVGKTCTSISIAEQYIDEIERLNKKVIILLNPSIKANFMKNIFNINKLKSGMTYYQCTGEKYLKEMPDFKQMLVDSPELLERKINNLIKKRYEFYGYQQFANLIQKTKKEIQGKYSSELHNKIYKNKIRSMFSDTVFIIDEVHNIKESNELKILPPILEEVFSLTENIKLLLLSATPMFDTSREIIYLMNLLLINDKKPKMNVSEYFDSNSNLYEQKIQDFLTKTKGYISYVRGENPYRFPLGIYPEKEVIKKDEFPIKDNIGEEIKEENRIKDLKIIPCVMKGLQKDVYNLMEESSNISGKSTYGAFNQPALMCSNIVFPINNIDELLERSSFRLDKFIGDAGLENIITKNKVNKKLKFSYKNDNIKELFDYSNLNNYSTKIHKILTNIQKSNGIVFIYSQFLASGILPLSLALENLGYKKYGGSLLSKKYESKETKGNYIIISGNNDLSKNAYADYIKIENKNINGDKVKIIIGSETAAEGLDFKYIREIHILEPWFHLNKLDQIIGRGIRNCSHIELSKEDRNVKIFLYASTMSTKPINDNETLDLKIYRNAEIKSVQMGKIEYLLKTNSVDCNFNIEENKYETDIHYSKKCNYENCDYKCNPDLKEILLKSEIDYDTINSIVLEDQINDVIKLIKFGNFDTKSLFKQKYYYSLDQILKKINAEKIVIFLALHKIITSNIVLFDRYNNEANLQFSNSKYILIPSHTRNKLITYNTLKSRKNNTINKLNISNNRLLTHISSQKNNNVKNSVKNSNNIKPNNIFVQVTKKSNNLINNSNSNIKPKKRFVQVTKKLNNLSNSSSNIKPFEKKTVNDIILKKLMPEEKLNSSIEKIKQKKRKNINQEKLVSMNSKIFEYGNIIDYLNPTNKELLIKYLIKNKNNNKLNDVEGLLFDNCYNILYKKKDVYYKDPSFVGSNDLFGYKIIENGKLVYYKIQGNTFIKTSIDESKAIEKSTLKKVEENNELRPSSLLCGYLENKMPSNEILFKIRDKKTEGIKGTQIKTGSVCNNDGMRKNKVVTYIQNVNELLANKLLTNIESSNNNENYKALYEIIYPLGTNVSLVGLTLKLNGKFGSVVNGDSENPLALGMVYVLVDGDKKPTPFSYKNLIVVENYKDVDGPNIPGKEFLCYELEIYFRYLDIIDDSKRYFYNSEETIEYKLNEK